MNNSLFAPSPRRKRGLILTLSGSLLFHGSLVGVAALWPTRPAPPPPIVTQLGDFGNTPDLPNEPTPDPQPSAPDPVQPDLKVAEPEPTDPPPAVDPDAFDMALASPTPRSIPRTAARSISSPSTPHTARASTTVSSPGTNLGGSGVGQPGLGVRWNKPKPIYPPSLRLAHIQGSGTVRVTTDASGHVVSAVIVQSTGNALLDDTTVRAAKSTWTGPANTTSVIPVTYQIR